MPQTSSSHFIRHHLSGKSSRALAWQNAVQKLNPPNSEIDIKTLAKFLSSNDPARKSSALLRGITLLGKRKMTASKSVVEERTPVWSVLSEFFLDTELSHADRERIAAVLAASPYTEKQLEEILRFEVTPLLRANLLSIAGEWAGFDEAWLREKLTPRIGKRPFFNFGVSLVIRAPWTEVKNLVSLLRSQ